jgi:DNA-binding transcriptional ArsR family regulator
MMTLEDTADCLLALGNPTRLAIIRYLMRKGDEGAPVGQIQKLLDIPASTLTHHIKHLENEGLVVRERQGTSLITRVDYDRFNQVLGFLTEECCIDAADHSTAHHKAHAMREAV